MLLEARIVVYPWERKLVLGIEQKETSEMLILFFFFIWILVTWKVQFVKIYQAVFWDSAVQ